MGYIQKQMFDANKTEHTNTLKEVKRLCKEFDFTVGMLQCAIFKGRR